MSLSSKINDLADRIGQEIKSLWTSMSNFETSSELNTRDTNNRDRSNHTGTQPVSTVTGLSQVATSNLYKDLDDKPIIPIEGLNVTGFINRVNQDGGNYEETECLNPTLNSLGFVPFFM